MKKDTYTRDFTPIETTSEANVLTFSVASPAPYERSDKKHGSYYEVLQISDEAINFERLVDQRCPFLYEHDTDKQIGVVERAWIENEKLYVEVRFSANFNAQEVVADIVAGIRRNCSIGYSVDEYKMIQNAGDPIPTMLVTRWTPFEASTVSTPADPFIGYQRSLNTEGTKNMKRNKKDIGLTEDEIKKLKDLLAETEDETEEKAEEPEEQAAPTEAEAPKEEEQKAEEPEEQKACDEEEKACDTEEEKACEEEEVKKKEACPTCGQDPCVCEEEEIRSLGDLLNKRDMAEAFITNKRSLAEFKDAIRTKAFENKEIEDMEKKFSLRKAIANVAGKISDEEAKFERDIIAENKRKFNVNDADIVLSKKEMRAFDGSESINQTVYKPGLYTPELRPDVTINYLGFTSVAVTGPSISFAVCTSGLNAGFVDLNGDVPSASMDFTLKTMAPRKQGAFCDISYTALLQDDPSAEGIVMDDIVKALDASKDYAFWNGTSGNNEPVGLLNVTGVNEVTLPATPTLSTALEFEKQIRASFDYSANLKWVMRHRCIL